MYMYESYNHLSCNGVTLTGPAVAPPPPPSEEKGFRGRRRGHGGTDGWVGGKLWLCVRIYSSKEGPTEKLGKGNRGMDGG